MPLREYLLALMAAPQAPADACAALAELPPDAVGEAMAGWLRSVRRLNPALDADFPQPAVIEMRGPYAARVRIRVVAPDELAATVDVMHDDDFDLTVLALCGDPEQAAPWLAAAREEGERVLAMEPSWVAAIAVEAWPPVLVGDPDAACREASPFVSAGGGSRPR